MSDWNAPGSARALLLVSTLCAWSACGDAGDSEPAACSSAGCACSAAAPCGGGFRCVEERCVSAVLGPAGDTAGTGGAGFGGSEGTAGSAGASAVRACAPGATQACLGPMQCPGVQICASDGLAWGTCDCGAGDGGVGGIGGGGAGRAAPDTSVGIWAKVGGVLEGSASPTVSMLMEETNRFYVADGLGVTIVVWWPGTPSTGSFPCVTGTLPGGSAPESRGAGVSYGLDYWSWAAGGTCMLTISELGTRSGARVAGSFSGQLPGNLNANPPADPPAVTITEGTFAVTLP